MFVMYTNNSVECSWIQCIESILNKLGLGYVWLNQCADIDFLWLKNRVTQSLSDQSRQEWNF